MNRNRPDDGTAAPDRKELNREVKDRKQREERRALRAHQNGTGRFFEDDLLVQLWVRLNVLTPAITAAEIDDWQAKWGRSRTSTARWAPWGCDLWWDDAFKRFITELQRLVGFSIGWIRGDEARPYRHIHVAIVAHQPVPVEDVRAAWLTVIGSESPEAAWVERYQRGGGGVSYGMKQDGEYGCNWQVSDNIDLFRRSGDGKIHRPSTSRERRHGRRVLKQRVAITTPKNPPSPTTRRVQPPVDRGPQPGAGVVRVKERQAGAVRLIDPRCGGRLVATYAAEVAA